eukprot:11496346-Heterocapsa_arctica.AAC.1
MHTPKDDKAEWCNAFTPVQGKIGTCREIRLDESFTRKLNYTGNNVWNVSLLVAATTSSWNRHWTNKNGEDLNKS